MMADLRLGVVGVAGRMGRALIREIAATKGARVSGGIEKPGSEMIGKDIGELAGIGPLGTVVTGSAATLCAVSDAVLDFSSPASTISVAKQAANAGTVHVVGTTGLEDADFRVLKRAAKDTAIIRAANMSVGVNFLIELTREVAARLGPDFDIEIVEMHHRMKVDAPSGTALALGEAAAEGRGVKLAKVSERGRDGITGPRKHGAIGFAALRGGNVPGDHTVIFAGDDERIELTHKAGDRAIFARGAVRAALWGIGKPAGYYGMADVLGFTKRD
jgi:4-hydroxy-tetrahydrodipicolinate reductase